MATNPELYRQLYRGNYIELHLSLPIYIFDKYVYTYVYSIVRVSIRERDSRLFRLFVTVG